MIATDEELNIFGKEMDKVSAMNTDVIEKSEMILRQFCVDGQSPFLNKTLKEAGDTREVSLPDCRCGAGRGDPACSRPA